ncbi:hypothetical protein GCM10010431_42050 [Streptomyces kunmingensis]
MTPGGIGVTPAGHARSEPYISYSVMSKYGVNNTISFGEGSREDLPEAPGEGTLSDADHDPGDYIAIA